MAAMSNTRPVSNFPPLRIVLSVRQEASTYFDLGLMYAYGQGALRDDGLDNVTGGELGFGDPAQNVQNILPNFNNLSSPSRPTLTTLLSWFRLR